MSLRLKLFLLPTLAIAAAAALVAVGSEQYARRQSQQAGQQRTQTLAAQFQREMTQRGDEAARAVQSVADAESTLRMALDLTRTQADPSLYANDARGLAKAYHLDFVELSAADGTLISSSHWAPASGYRNDWVANESDWNHQAAFLSRVPLPDHVELGLLAVRAVRVGERNLYVIGGWRFDRAFLRTLAVPEGMRALLYANLEQRFVPEALTGPEGPVAQPEPFAPLIESLQRGENSQPQTIQASDRGSLAETFITVPLQGRGGERLAALLVGNSQQDLAMLVKYIRSLALLATGLGVLFSLVLAWWFSSRVSRPLAQLADAARELPSGKLTSRPELRPRGETAAVAAALNDVSGQMSRDRERLVQRERVAARREMSRRFARDLKESIFPLHMAAEDLLHAREETSERFDEIFFECNTSIRAELDRLKNVAARFGEFGRESRPRPVPVNVNEIARAVLKSIEPQFHAAGRPPVTPEIHLGEPEPIVEADPDLLRAALENLLLHCLDAMPSGGALAVRTRAKDAVVHIEVSARGASFTAEDCQRLFVPAGNAPEGMTGLGLATAHAVVTDHGGRISAESAPGAGTTVRLEFPAASAHAQRPARTDTARQAHAEPARQARSESAKPTSGAIAQPAPPVAAPEPPAEVPVAAMPAEPVQVTIVAAETAATSEEVPTTASDTSSKPDQPSGSARSRRGLTFTA
jgi:signal transduction histidine kinase